MTDQKEKVVLNKLNIEKLEAGQIGQFWLKIAKDGLGMPINIPVLVAKGNHPGKVIGLTAVVHGNELNGIPVIQGIFKQLDMSSLVGTIIGIPVLNVPAYLRKKRRFIDGTDLNHIMPGKSVGTVSQVYAWRIVEKVIKKLDYLIDLHTASNGRINSFYVRADMNDAVVRKMALLQNAQIIVHNPPSDGTLRGTADELGIPAITLEIGNPNLFQNSMIEEGMVGIKNVLAYLGFIPENPEELSSETVQCSHSYWLYTDSGGLLTVLPKVTDIVEKGEVVAVLSDVFGDIKKSYKAPEKGIVIGRSVSPINHTGGRILHLGVLKGK